MIDNRKFKKRSKVKPILLGLVIIYIIYKLSVGFIFNPNKTMVVSSGKIKNSEMVKCLFIRDEVLIKSSMEGTVNYYVKSGERIELGATVAEIHSANLDSEDRKRLVAINKRIDDINNSNSEFFKSDIDKINNEIDKLVNQMIDARKKGNYERANELNTKIEALADKKQRITGEKFSKSTLDRLRDERNDLEQSMKDSMSKVKIPMAGVISFYTDGYEDKLNPNNLMNLSSDFIERIDVHEGQAMDAESVIYDTPMFKLIDNSRWYVAIIINDSNKRFFKPNKKITIKVEDSEATLRVTDILKDGSKEIAILESNQYLKNYDKYRYKESEVIYGEYEGLKLFRDSLVTKDGITGVYRTSYDNVPKFIPVKPIGYDDTYVVVKNNEFYDSNKEKVKTIRLYDEIYRNGKKYN